MMGGGRCAFCQVSTISPQGQVPLKLQQALLIVESHVVGSASLPSQIQIQRPADLLHTTWHINPLIMCASCNLAENRLTVSQQLCITGLVC